MLNPSDEIIQVLQVFAVAATVPTFAKMRVLIIGVILAPGARTVCAALRVMGLGDLETYGKYHRVLNRDRWSPWIMSQLLLQLLISTFLTAGVRLTVIIDETLERRKGEKIKYKGIFRDGARSTRKHVVKSAGVRWACLTLLVPVPWASRPWALPFMSAPILSPKTSATLNKRHRSSIDWSLMMLRKVRYWQPEREIIVVGDGAYAAARLVQYCQKEHMNMTLVSRLRLDAVLYAEAGERPKGKRGPPASKGKKQASMSARLNDESTVWSRREVEWYRGEKRVFNTLSEQLIWHPKDEAQVKVRWVLVNDPLDKDFEAFLLMSSNLKLIDTQIIGYFVQRWNIEVMFEESRSHMGIETQRQWSDRAIERSTPCLFGIFSLVVVMAKRLFPVTLPIRREAWYEKTEVTYADVLAAVRKHLWLNFKFARSGKLGELGEIPINLFERLLSVAAYA
ncbi:MAG: hypothetical protein EBV05_13000 [Cyanobacteria bacterium WB6_1B_304]|jgi:hypothetical protein|nr:hypothetical protein [Cyanobacteria bacterium WB6_1B_304]